jgi:hypothetical protein
MKILVIVLSVVAIVFIIYLAGVITLAINFRNQIKELINQSTHISDQTYHQAQLIGLPAPVQRYFKYALRDGQPLISFVRMKHVGRFKSNIKGDWMNIEGEQYASIDKPGFIWKGTTTFFSARDMYINDKGKLIVTLFSIVNTIDVDGKPYNQGELLRWLGESVLYPTNLLPNQRLQWLPIDHNKARLLYNYHELSLFFDVTFNDAGQIVEMQTERYKDKNTMATWIIKMSNYEEKNNVMIPTSFDVAWRLDDEDFSYAKFDITEIFYDKPSLFF